MRKMVTVVHCDACAKKGEEQDANTTLEVAGDSYDLCGTHGEKFRAYFEALFTAEMTTAQSA